MFSSYVVTCVRTLCCFPSERPLLVTVTFPINWQQMCWQLHFNFERTKIIFSVGPWHKLHLAEWVMLVICWGCCCQSDARISKHQSSGLFWNAALFVSNSAYRHLPLSVVKMMAKGDTSGLSLSCCRRVCLFCSHVSSFHVEASLQRDGGSATAPRPVPSRGFNKQYRGNPGSPTPQAAILSCCESWRDHTLVSAGMEEVRLEMTQEEKHPSWAGPSIQAGQLQQIPRGVVVSSLSEVSAAQWLCCRGGLSSCSVISRAAGSLVLHFMCCPCLGISWHPPIQLRAEILILHLKRNFRS